MQQLKPRIGSDSVQVVSLTAEADPHGTPASQLKSLIQGPHLFCRVCSFFLFAPLPLGSCFGTTTPRCHLCFKVAMGQVPFKTKKIDLSGSHLLKQATSSWKGDWRKGGLLILQISAQTSSPQKKLLLASPRSSLSKSSFLAL